MKKIYKKEEGVSPVIATILMVAITVVLAATVYIMVAGLGGTTPTRVAGSLTYRAEYSSDSKAVFEISLSQPSSTTESKITVKVLDDTGAVKGVYWFGNSSASGIISSASINHVVSTGTTVKSGDLLEVSLTTGNSFGSGYKVIVTISGYSGTIEGNVP